MSPLGNFRAGSRERERGLGGKMRRRGKAGEKKEKKKKQHPTSLSGVSSESSPTHTSGSYISKLISHIEAV